jgi:hypothetical protein
MSLMMRNRVRQRLPDCCSQHRRGPAASSLRQRNGHVMRRETSLPALQPPGVVLQLTPVNLSLTLGKDRLDLAANYLPFLIDLNVGNHEMLFPVDRRNRRPLAVEKLLRIYPVHVSYLID